MSYQRFDMKSDLTAVGNALTENDARIKSLKAQLQQAEEDQRHLSAIMSQRIGVIFSESGAPDFDGKAILRKIEANVKRSMSRLLPTRKNKAVDPKMLGGQLSTKPIL
jgi:hypothetical protein